MKLTRFFLFGLCLLIASVLGAADIPMQFQFADKVIDASDRAAYWRLNAAINQLLASPRSAALHLSGAKFHFATAQEKLLEQGVPAQYAYITVPESTGNIQAVSYKGALGLWQTMPATALRFGSTPSAMFDPAQNSQVAAKYLRFLIDKFNGDPLLVIAAWNTGEDNVDKAIARAGTTNFWRLQLHPETMDFVPKVLAYFIVDTQNLLGDLSVPSLAYVPSFQLPSSFKIGEELAEVKLKIKGDRVTIPRLTGYGKVGNLLRWNPHLNVYNWASISLPQDKTITVLVPKELRHDFVINLVLNLPNSVEVI
ncbi:lytic transglycosylase domain-containing protein [Candidatus Parcubacteria bacterium]|nr:MAG: lytic transglycosylase domain-containing protein [Candidatus Parcubacteria bacterium]